MLNNRYTFLDGLRGVAAIFVLMRHTENFWEFELFRSYLAADIFFILSGFVIAHAYDEKLHIGAISLKKFILIRLIRLYPVFILSVLLCSALLIQQTLKSQTDFNNLSEIIKMIFMAALFLPFSMKGDPFLFAINAPYWSLFFELISNFIYGATRPKLNNFWLNTIIIASGLFVGAAAYFHGDLNVGFYRGYKSVAAGFSRSVFGIFMGLFLYRHREVLQYYLGKLISPWLSFIIISLILISPSLGRIDCLIDIMCVYIIFPITIVSASLGDSRKLNGILLTLGSASYPLYVMHKPFGMLMTLILHKAFGGYVIERVYAPVSGIMLVMILISISLIIEKFYDIPLRRSIYNYALSKNR